MSYQIVILVVGLSTLVGSLVSGGSIGQATNNFDWRDTPGLVSSIKDQGESRPLERESLYSFRCKSLTPEQLWPPNGADSQACFWEASSKLHNNTSLVYLSAQNTIDFTTAGFDCEGCLPWAGMTAIESEADFIYKGALGPFALNASNSLLNIDYRIQRGSFRTDAVKFGELPKTCLPVEDQIAATIDGSSDNIKIYKSCSQQKEELKHGVLHIAVFIERSPYFKR